MKEKVKIKCEKCGRDLKRDTDKYSCSYNCTFCAKCAMEMNYVCPNCSGKLSKRKKKN